MANNPVQIVLNAQNYVRRSEINPGGSIKDFYAGRNEDFVRHRDALAAQLNELQQAHPGAQPDDVFYARVTLQADAWAKSHRPINKVFQPNKQAYVGGAELGSMVVELTPNDIPRIAAVVSAAESVVKQVEKGDKLVDRPSRARSEVGAIASVRNYSASDRRKFSTEQAMQWLADPRTGGAYYVETFVSWKSIEERRSDSLKERGARALSKFESKLNQLNLPIEISKASDEWINASIYIIKVTGASTESRSTITTHAALLEFLDNEPVVKAVHLPPILQAAQVSGEAEVQQSITPPVEGKSYPIVGVIDTGVCKIPALSAWSAGSIDFVSESTQDVSHGTFIAGLLCAADTLNHDPLFAESKCLYFDLGLHPTADGTYENYYPHGFLDFLHQLDAEIPAAKEKGVRVFNMSLAVTSPVTDDGYSLFANLLDEIADKHDVLFVLPAGNLDAGLARDEWPLDANEAAAMLAGYPFAGQDRIFQPADSIRALVVGALDPKTTAGRLLPARYSRRGPGPSLGAKPDLAHIGGKLHNESGLYSILPSGEITQNCGTSFSSPLVAKTVAALDHAIEGNISCEALSALVLHHAEIPTGLDDPVLRSVSHNYIGAGVPRHAVDTLLVEDYEITIVFNGVLINGHELQFQFSWPANLVNASGGCTGDVKLTLVYRPPTDRKFGGEFVRINLDAYLRQEEVDSKTGEIHFKGRLKGDGSKTYEKELIRHGAKWWPVKRLKGNFKTIGKSSQWRLVIDPLARSEYAIPDDGIPFSVILTITDPERTSPIFNQMRQQLQSAGANISDIRSALRPRVR